MLTSQETNRRGLSSWQKWLTECPAACYNPSINDLKGSQSMPTTFKCGDKVKVIVAGAFFGYEGIVEAVEHTLDMIRVQFPETKNKEYWFRQHEVFKAYDLHYLEDKGAKTYDDGKEPLAWLPWGGIDEVSKVQMYGHKKYKDFNNYRKGLSVSRNLSCALRHIRDYMDGRDTDHESGNNPLAHAACRILFVLQNLKDKVAIDDRYKK